MLTPDARAQRALIEFCERRTRLLDWKTSARYRPALLALSAHAKDWVRPLGSWGPPREEAPQQFRCLLRHLFALYEIPPFLDAAWLEGLTPDGVRYQEWYKHIGRGRNIRTARGLPIALTRAMAPHFALAPAACSIPEAIRYAQVLGLGGDERLFRSLMGTRIGRSFDHDDFWETVIRWFIEQAALGHEHHGPIVDYLHAQKFVPSVTNPRSRLRGQPREATLIPPQPNLCMRGRTAAAMLRAVDRWHTASASTPAASSIEWKPTGIPPLLLSVGDGAQRRTYETIELITAEELGAEGRAMRHCVGSYWRQCASGEISIWSMTLEGTSAVVRLLTLEVQNASRCIVQARGPCNRLVTEEELSILSRWADAGGPSYSRWLIAGPPIER